MLLTHHTPDGVRRSRHQSLTLYGAIDCALGDDRIAELTEIARLARLLTQADCAMVNLLPAGRQVAVAANGADAPEELAEEHSVCAALLEQRPVSTIVVPDLSRDRRFCDNPYVNGEIGAVRGFASAPIIGHERVAVGTLCVWSLSPVTLTRDQTSMLDQLAKAAVTVFDVARRERPVVVQRFPARVMTPQTRPAA